MTDLAQTAPTYAPSKNQATLCVAYGVYGLPKETSGWQRAPTLPSGAVEFSSPNVVRLRFKPDILGSSPKNAEITDPASTKLLHAAMRASYPNDVEICFGDTQPPCVSHSFVLQQSSTSTLYGVSLQVWSKADEKRCQSIYQLRCRDEQGTIDETAVYWIPYSLCFLSPYPLFNLLSDYLKGMWIHWSKSTNLFHAEEVSRILSFPAPRLQDLVRIDMQDYALAYQFPNHSSGFQNFAMWPLFSCLSVPNVVSILETALSPAGRIIFTTRYPAMLNLAAESVRLACRLYEWTGLYVPVGHCASVKNLVEEKGPYIIGVTKECRKLINPPADALVVDLDQGLIQTRTPPIVFAKASSRQKFVNRLSAVLGSCDTPGVPGHLREAYAGGQLTPEGQVICIKGRIELVEEPAWWNQDGVLATCDHVCKKLAKNKGLKALTSGTTRKPLTTKISIRALQEIEREKSSNAREVNEAWLAYCLLKSKMGTEIRKLTKRNEFLLEELNTWKTQFEKFQLVAQDLTKQSLELKRKIEAYKVENKQLNVLIKERTLEYTQMKVERDTMVNTNDDLVKEKQHLKEKLRVAKKQNEVLLQQREEVEGVLQALKDLIKTQPAALEDIIEGKASEDTELQQVMSNQPATASARFQNEVGPLNATSKAVEQIETVSAFERTLAMSSRNSTFSKRSSITDVADAVVRERTREITSLINRITADCVAAIDRISVADEEDSPFTGAVTRRSMLSNIDGASSVSSISQKRQSNMTSVSEAIADLDLPVARPVRTNSVQSRGKSQKSQLAQAIIPEVEV